MSDHTFLAYRNDLTSFFTFLETQYELTGIREVKHTHIRSWLAGLKEEQCSERTLQRKISAVKSLFKYLLRTGTVTVNPTRLVLTPKAPARLPVFLEEQQTELMGGGSAVFAEGFEGATEYLILELLYQTGMRRAELVQLKETDVEYGRKQIRVLGKRNKERMVPVGDALLVRPEAFEISGQGKGIEVEIVSTVFHAGRVTLSCLTPAGQTILAELPDERAGALSVGDRIALAITRCRFVHSIDGNAVS